jgi:hypothetical protein
MRTLLAFIAIYILLIFRHGYVFGSGDQSEMLPYAKYLIDSSLYPKDFYIQNIADHIPNERFVFSWLMSRWGSSMEIAAFALHFLATMGLLFGLRRLSQKWLHTEGGVWLGTIVPILLFYGINLGGNELYYNLLIPSYLAQVMGLWMFNSIMEGKFERSYIFLSLAIFIHPLIGLHLWVLMILMKLGFGIWQFKDHAGRNFFILQGLCIVVFGTYLWQIKGGYDGSTAMTNDLFFDIMKFRAAHHYFPRYFGFWNWVILVPAFLYAYSIAMPQLKRVFMYIVLGIIVYIIGVYVFKSTLPLSMQWFAATVWLKTFVFITLVRVLEEGLTVHGYDRYLDNKPLITNTLMIGALACGVFIYPPLAQFKAKSYDLPFWQHNTAEVRISQLAKQNTPSDALFLVPIDLTPFRYWSERSTYVDFKAINHQQNALAEWYRRVIQVYNINVSNRTERSDVNFMGNTNYRNLDTDKVKNLAQQTGVTHFLTFKEHNLSFPKIGDNEQYVIYKIE